MTDKDKVVFQQRRKKYMDKNPNAVTILVGAKEKLKTGDVHYKFRQDNNFYYLAGFDEPDAVMVLAPCNKKYRFTLFVRPKDEKMEIWTGNRYGPRKTRKIFGVDKVYPLTDLDKELPKYFEGHDKLFYRLGDNPEFDLKIICWLKDLRAKYRAGNRVPLDIFDPTKIFHQMRVCKSRHEVGKIMTAQRITAEGFKAAMKTIKPGLYEWEIESLLEYYFRKQNCMGPGYAIIVASYENGTILHYTQNTRQMGENELVVIDAGAEYDYYSADITRTIPVNGKFSSLQEKVYNIVLEAQVAAIKTIRPGITIRQVHLAALKKLVQGLIQLKLVDGPLHQALRKNQYKQFYMHGTSHFLGMDVHDVGRVKNENQWVPLKPGMVLTVEPGLYFSPKIKGLPARFKGLAIRIEDNVLVTRSGHRNLTCSIPKTVKEIEDFMK